MHFSIPLGYNDVHVICRRIKYILLQTSFFSSGCFCATYNVIGTTSARTQCKYIHACIIYIQVYTYGPRGALNRYMNARMTTPRRRVSRCTSTNTGSTPDGWRSARGRKERSKKIYTFRDPQTNERNQNSRSP